MQVTASPAVAVPGVWRYSSSRSGVLITAVDTTIVVVTLPNIHRCLHVEPAMLIWLIAGYLLVITVLLTHVGRFGDMFCRVRLYEAGWSACTSARGNAERRLWLERRLRLETSDA